MRIPPDSEKSNLIRIEGDPQGVQQAKRELLELASRMVRPTARPCWGGVRLCLLGDSAGYPLCGPGEWDSLGLGVTLSCRGPGAVLEALGLCSRAFGLGETPESGML